MIGSPPAFRDFVLAGEIVIPFGAGKIIMLQLILVFLVHRNQHPPAIGFPAVEEDQFLRCAGNGNVELAIVAAVLELPVVLAEEEPFHEIP